MEPKPNQHGQLNMRGFKKVYMISVLEGEGVKGNPSKIVNYIYDDEKDQYLGFVMRDAFTHNYFSKD